EERDPKRCTHIELPVNHYVIRISPNIRDMNDLAFEGSSRHRASTRGDRISFHVSLVLGGVAVRRDMLEEFPNWARKGRPVGLAQPCRRLDQRVEHGLQIEGRAADDLEHVGGGGLLLQRFAEIVSTLAQLV